MFKHYFERVYNVEVWPIISLIIFFTFFVGLLWYVWKMSKSHVDKMSNMPLEEDPNDDLEDN
ncbi:MULTISPECIES: cbb3-type cytochrome c oxidase subunit 3 [Persicobacter]|uniref:CcoQ/FixQ family Cbb3-type cytochrome c oxidase assembly chaperone n=1 Tax=Persicobacter diffluens TaxID=981 RepID=A0AAN5AME5_9BACT|nr:cbb3-type cytochrome c oxidase subunit 3 [Persicobacter sp. CCB-QB2]GJM62321.1 hypothetical protein PEDI_28730 [Persicobacter diffluens]